MSRVFNKDPFRHMPDDPVKKCHQNCFYLNATKEFEFCDYLFMTGHRRPCPAGRSCTEYKRKRR